MSNEFLDALSLKNKGHLPVWFMRQAGRYLPEYMAIKRESNFRKMSHTPNIMAEITLQPLRRYPVDAAIMFSDILTCLEYMGAPFEFKETGPHLEDSGRETVKSLTKLNPERTMSFVREGIQLIRKDLNGRPLIGFVGAPFTLISYLVEGGTSKDFHETKRFLFEEEAQFHAAMTHISREIAEYLIFQIDSGVQAVQIFDSWVGILSADQYEKHILPHMKALISEVKSKRKDTPIILYSQPTTHLLPLLAQTGANALSVDWRMKIEDIAKLIPDNIAIQGNLDPIVTTLPWEKAQGYVQVVIDSAKKAKILNRYIFNVGHGVTPQTNTETLGKIIDWVHTHT